MHKKSGRPRVNRIGERHWKLVVVSQAGVDERNETLWLCQCDCGNDKVVRNKDVSTVMSCGCAKSSPPRIVKHGHWVGGVKTAEYTAWASMISRCESPTSGGYKNYGGRGITVCPRWRDSFEAFLEDMGLKLSPELSIDRINNDGNYEPRGIVDGLQE